MEQIVLEQMEDPRAGLLFSFVLVGQEQLDTHFCFLAVHSSHVSSECIECLQFGNGLHEVALSISRDTERNKDLAFLEAQIYEYVEVLGVRIVFGL